MRYRGARQQVQRRVVHDVRAVQDAAVAVVGVLAEANVGHDEHLRIRGLDRANRLLRHPVGGVGLRPQRVLGRGQTEEDDARDAQLGGLADLSQRLVG